MSVATMASGVGFDKALLLRLSLREDPSHRKRATLQLWLIGVARNAEPLPGNTGVGTSGFSVVHVGKGMQAMTITIA